VIRVRVIPFGVLKDRLDSSVATVELPEGASVGDLLERLSSSLPAGAPAKRLRGIAVGVNAEYAQSTRVLSDGDEVALLPPVSGGVAHSPSGQPDPILSSRVFNENGNQSAIAASLTREPIDIGKIVASAKRPEDGAVVVFDGIARDRSRGRRTLYLDYEAYEGMAVRQMRELGARARERFAIRHVTIVHRLGRLEIGETSVLIVVASAHRAAAFEACRWLIDTLKQTVPIWKKETFADGAVWAPGEPFPQALAVDLPEALDEK